MRRFEGWEPRTFFDYDDDGRLVSSWPEPEWDEEQQGWMLALSEYRAGMCTGCGLPLRESTDEKYDFVVPPPTRCWGCDAVSLAQNKDKRDRPEALRWSVRRR